MSHQTLAVMPNPSLTSCSARDVMKNIIGETGDRLRQGMTSPFPFKGCWLVFST